MGWFPYLFYSTTWVAEVMAQEIGREPDIDKATRAGSLALLIYSFGECCPTLLIKVAIFAGTLLPYLAARDHRLLKQHDADDEDEEIDRVREMVRQWKAEAARDGRPLKLPTSGSCLT
jgi:solute carrier family 45 protein 1/2/4